MSVCYTVVDGEIIHENRGGAERFYIADPLGNTAALVDTTGAVTDSYTFWPYGEIQSHTGSSTTPFTFVGTWGYFADTSSRAYIRARSMRFDLSQWTSVDPTWPNEPGYDYCWKSPTNYFDKSGKRPTRSTLTMLFCVRPVDYTPVSHWFISVPGCGTMGYGPSGLIGNFHDNSNFLDRVNPELDCWPVNITPAQAKCLCRLKRLFGKPGAPAPFCKPWQGSCYNPVNHNCQNFIQTILNHCGLSAPTTELQNVLDWPFGDPIYDSGPDLR